MLTLSNYWWLCVQFIIYTFLILTEYHLKQLLLADVVGRCEWSHKIVAVPENEVCARLYALHYYEVYVFNPLSPLWRQNHNHDASFWNSNYNKIQFRLLYSFIKITVNNLLFCKLWKGEQSCVGGMELLNSILFNKVDNFHIPTRNMYI